MALQCITLTKQNNDWLEKQVDAQEFLSKSEGVNYLINQAREKQEYDDFVQIKINKGLKSGYTKKQTREEMLAEIKSNLKF
ncbi:CopG family transcriptional regulator [Gelidibacter gilvus]|uniref:CopG family transcriptional regulator n=2 Tax=Gelidibacter maritimus TaxID=2761487 RepID=A0A7W2R3H0_9FLAO|nr:CopG family transcriptional regulator [Gelidibacter maritimus]